MRTVALDRPLAEALFEHLGSTPYSAPDDRVFCHPSKGSAVYGGAFGAMVKSGLARGGVERSMREYHDWCHTGITNAAAAGMQPLAIMQMAGHSDFKTTKRYINLAKVVFADEVKLLSDWYGESGTNRRYQDPTGVPQSVGIAHASASCD